MRAFYRNRDPDAIPSPEENEFQAKTGLRIREALMKSHEGR
jgi:hypothetical protein